jgi:hypothetical protein
MQRNFSRRVLVLLVAAGTTIATLGSVTASPVRADGPFDNLEKKGTQILGSVVEQLQDELLNTLQDVKPTKLLKGLLNN